MGGFLLQLTVVCLVTMALLEGVVAWSFRYPGASLVPPMLLRNMHLQFDRDIIQVLPECAVYDAGVTYTLRPGTCTFSSREFSNEYRVNRLGLRDDEVSLASPDTVILGDSLAMGWGVDQEEAFPAVFERMAGRRTLNAGISSFGTVRALMILSRIDRSSLRDLVVQYMENDFIENEQFVRDGSLRILTEQEYARTVETQRRIRRYYPGKYGFNVLVQLQSSIRAAVSGGQQAAPVGARRQAEVFLQVLQGSPVDLSSYRLTVMSIDPAFVREASEQASSSEIPWIRGIRFVDVGLVLQFDGSYYTLDDHPTSRGHQAIGRELVRVLAR